MLWQNNAVKNLPFYLKATLAIKLHATKVKYKPELKGYKHDYLKSHDSEGPVKHYTPFFKG